MKRDISDLKWFDPLQPFSTSLNSRTGSEEAGSAVRFRSPSKPSCPILGPNHFAGVADPGVANSMM